MAAFFFSLKCSFLKRLLYLSHLSMAQFFLEKKCNICHSLMVNILYAYASIHVSSSILGSLKTRAVEMWLTFLENRFIEHFIKQLAKRLKIEGNNCCCELKFLQSLFPNTIWGRRKSISKLSCIFFFQVSQYENHNC